MAARIGIAGGSSVAQLGVDRFYEFLEAAESQGWDSVWFSDRLVGSAWTIDPIVAMAMAAARTRRIRFGTGVLLMSMRSPVAAARALASIDALSGGRLMVGVGVGQGAPLEYEAMGVEMRERGSRLDEAIRVMRRLWTEERVTYRGRYLTLNAAGISPMPVQRPIPLWIGGRAPGALRRAGRLGDGWLPTQLTPEELAADTRRVQSHAAEAGRRLPSDGFGANLQCYVVERGAVPMDHVVPHLLHRRHDVAPQQLHLLGTPDQIVARLHEYEAAGATQFVLGPACPPEEFLGQMELLAQTVLRSFHPTQV